MTGYDPLDGVPPVGRYDEGNLQARGGGGQYRSLPFTLEDEANAGGWLPGATPTCGPSAPPLQRLYTLGMRGEPGYDDDPVPERPFTNRYTDGAGHVGGDEGHD